MVTKPIEEIIRDGKIHVSHKYFKTRGVPILNFCIKYRRGLITEAYLSFSQSLQYPDTCFRIESRRANTLWICGEIHKGYDIRTTYCKEHKASLLRVPCTPDTIRISYSGSIAVWA